MKKALRIGLSIAIVAVLFSATWMFVGAYDMKVDKSYRKSSISDETIIYIGSGTEMKEYVVKDGETLTVAINSSPLEIVLPYEIMNDYHWRPEWNSNIMVLSSELFDGVDRPAGVLGGCSYMQRLTIQISGSRTPLVLYAYDHGGNRMELRLNIVNK